MTDTLLQIQNLDIRFRIDRKSEPFRAVKGISFDIPTNTTVALVGESGSGKSVSAMRLHMGMGLRQARARAIELLGEVGIPDPRLRVNSYPHEMSGGQQQRVMIAMAIACEPKLLIADEPTTALDVTIQKQILDLLASLQTKHRMSVLFITHDLGVVGDIADSVVVMQNGVIHEQGPVKAIFEHPQHPYTKALLACRPRLDRRPRRLPVIDDFMKGDGRPQLTERKRGTSPDDTIILEVKDLNKTFFLKEGLFGKRAVPAVKHVSFKLPKRTAGASRSSSRTRTPRSTRA